MVLKLIYDISFVSTCIQHNNKKMNIKIYGLYLKLVLLIYFQRNSTQANSQGMRQNIDNKKRGKEYTNLKVIGGRIHKGRLRSPSFSSIELFLTSPSFFLFKGLFIGTLVAGTVGA